MKGEVLGERTVYGQYANAETIPRQFGLESISAKGRAPYNVCDVLTQPTASTDLNRSHYKGARSARIRCLPDRRGSNPV